MVLFESLELKGRKVGSYEHSPLSRSVVYFCIAACTNGFFASDSLVIHPRFPSFLGLRPASETTKLSLRTFSGEAVCVVTKNQLLLN